eukprot:SAG31_NODE_41976_length_273_cov_1.195402_1_plen_57_part_10
MRQKRIEGRNVVIIIKSVAHDSAVFINIISTFDIAYGKLGSSRTVMRKYLARGWSV